MLVPAGTLAACAPAEEAPAQEEGDFLVVVQYHAPCVLPWVWDAARAPEERHFKPHALPLRAGAAGALGATVEFPQARSICKHSRLSPVTG